MNCTPNVLITTQMRGYDMSRIDWELREKIVRIHVLSDRLRSARELLKIGNRYNISVFRSVAMKQENCIWKEYRATKSEIERILHRRRRALARILVLSVAA